MEPMLPNPNSGVSETPLDQGELGEGAGVEQSFALTPEQASAPPTTSPTTQDDSVQDDGTTAAQADDVTQAPATQLDSPSMADDVDVIEKEWVNKAKKIVASTKDNPREQEKEVSRLQSDYLMKRYGKEIKASQ